MANIRYGAQTYQTLLSEKEFLRVRQRAAKLSGAFVDQIYYTKDRPDILFRVRSGTDPRLTWYVTIRITDISSLDKISRIPTMQLAKRIRESGLKIACTCLKRGTKVTVIKGTLRVRHKPSSIADFKDVTLKQVPIERIQKEDYVLNSMGIPQLVADVIVSHHSDWVEFIFEYEGSLRTICSTLDHRFRVLSKDGIVCTKQAKNIKFSDSFLQPKSGVIFVDTIKQSLNYNPCRILEIKYHSGSVKEEFYDICLYSKPHDFLAEGIVSKNCPAFKYFYSYKAWMNGYGLIKETRFPRVRNPHQQGYVCFRKGSLVLTSRGYKPIEDINIGDWVYTHVGRLRKVTKTFISHTDKLIAVRVGKKDKLDFNTIYCTPNHKSLTFPYEKKSLPSRVNYRTDEVQWIKAKDLKPGYMMCCPFLSNEEKIEFSEKDAFILGLFISDGNLKYSCVNSSTRFFLKEKHFMNLI